MSLSDGAVVALAQQAADLRGPGGHVRVHPPANDDPYRFGGHGWTVRIDPDVDVWIPAEASPTEVLFELIDNLGLDGEADIDGAEVVLRDRQTGEVIQRITPEASA